ncbi:MAG: hypothetical protein IJA48_03165 [Oscillospiraceae bacterium]|nr:hypothetical protein [Oscillospiraceae bacterium]
MKQTLLILLALSLLLLSGCSCDHRWREADCLSPKTCESCGETEGEALGHSPGEWTETIDITACTIEKEQLCTRCGIQTGTETEVLDSLIRDELFLYTPEEFMARMAAIAEAYNDPFTYQITDSETGLMVEVQTGETAAFLQFFYADTSTFTYEDRNSRKVWCTSLIFYTEADANLQHYYLMAVDPTLDQDGAFQTQVAAFTAYANATLEGTAFGYYEQNGILFEYSYLSDDLTGWGYTLDMTNVYASDFR